MSQINSIVFIILRRMRAPLIVLIAIYAIAVCGLTLIPGVDAAGKPAPPLSFFHAFYFVSYTATTIGFGEIPTAFSDAQRLWVTLAIYLTVIGWSYSIVTLLALLQDKGFQSALITARFARRVRALREPFYLICGCGETGGLVCHALDRLGQRFVVLESREQRVQELDLEDFKTDTPALAADAALPANLLLAGLRHPQCRGVLALTDDDSCNLNIAIAVRLLHPEIPVLARTDRQQVAANMASFGADHIINPFEIFADSLALALRAPASLRLCEILTGLAGSALPEVHRPPLGAWIVCGYGRFGRAVAGRLQQAEGQALTILETRVPDDAGHRVVTGNGNDANCLRMAGVAEAVGIVAGTSSDSNNLAIAMTARELNPALYVVMRQNQAANALLFEAFPDDYTLVPSQVVAQACVAILTAPLLERFLQLVRQQSNDWAATLAERLLALCGARVPQVWSVRLDTAGAPALEQALRHGEAIGLGVLTGDGGISSLPLLIERADRQLLLLPDGATRLQAGDHLLFAGRRTARSEQMLLLNNVNALDQALGKPQAGSWFGRWLARRA